MSKIAAIALSPALKAQLEGWDCKITGLDNNYLAIEARDSIPEQGVLNLIDPNYPQKIIKVSRHEQQEQKLIYKAADSESSLELEDLLNIIRKNQHIEICQKMDVEASDRGNGFEQYSFQTCTLPDLNWDDLTIEQNFLGQNFSAPIFITGMTGGIEKGILINERLAKAAQHFRIPMGVGSQRIALENPEHAKVFQLKKFAPRLFLIGNIGMSQLPLGSEVETCLKTINMIKADALAIHINVLQELVQVEGQRDFRGILDRIHEIANKLPVPLIIKEVGTGMDTSTAIKLHEAGVRYIDIGGKGGTSWALIEGLRSNDPVTAQLGHTFRNWGISTGSNLTQINNLSLPIEVTATGGIRDGITVAKAVALGAKMAGIGLPLFRASLTSENAPFVVLETLIRELKTTMLCTESCNLTKLKDKIVDSHAIR